MLNSFLSKLSGRGSRLHVLAIFLSRHSAKQQAKIVLPHATLIHLPRPILGL